MCEELGGVPWSTGGVSPAVAAMAKVSPPVAAMANSLGAGRQDPKLVVKEACLVVAAPEALHFR